MKRLVLLCAMVLLAATLLVYGDPPKTLDTIPIYPGAAKGSVDHDWPAALAPNASLTERVTYTVDAWPEEVVAWYQKQLGGMNDPRAWESAAAKTAVGAVSPVLYRSDPVTAAQEKDLTTTRTVQDYENHVVGKWDGAWVKGALQNRPRSADGWLWGGTFVWVYNRSPKNVPQLKVTVDFGGRDSVDRTGHAAGPIDGINKKLTRTVAITFSVQRPAPQWWARTETLDDAARTQLVAMYDNPPTEKDLGVPLYPGTELDFATLISNPGMIGYLFPYDSNDPVAKVLAFYEKATGKKAQEQSKGNYGILLRGDQKAPQLAVSFMDMTALLSEQQRKLMSSMGAAEPGVIIAVAKDMDKRKLSDADAARFDALKKAPPTEMDLGAPLYPGAALDCDALKSSMMNGGWADHPDYPYSAPASTEKVLEFYKGKAGQAPTASAGQYVFTFSSSGSLTAVAVRNAAGSRSTAIEYRVNKVQATGATQSLAEDAAKAKFLQVVKTGTTQDIQAAIKAGAAVNPDKPFMGIAPLKQAVVFNPSCDAIMTLLKAGADARAQGGLGDTVLAEAANHITDVDFLKALIKAGTDASGANPDVHHALIAAANQNASPAVVELLLASGADAKAADKYGVTPFRAIQPNAKLFGTPVYWKIADASGETLLDMAAYASADVIQAAIGHGAKADVKNDKGKTPLLVAAEKNPDPAVLQLLLKGGANAKAKDADGINALQYAVGVSATTAGTNPQLAAAASAMNAAALSMATGSLSGRPVKPAGSAVVPATGIPEKIVALIGAGAPVNVGDANGMTPLHGAIRSNQNVEVIAALLKGGADIEAKVGANVAQPQVQASAPAPAAPAPSLSPKSGSQGGGITGLFGGLLGGAAKSVQGAAQSAGQNAAQGAAQGATNKAISGAGEAAGMTPLILACYTAADNDRIDTLLKARPKVNATDDTGRTALIAAAGRDYEAIPLLIAAGAQVNVTDKKGMTPLLAVVAPRKDDIGATIGAALTLTAPRLKVSDPVAAVQVLLKAEAQPNVTDTDGRTPLIYAASLGNVGLVNQLLAAGAKPNVADKAGTTPLLAALTSRQEGGTADTVTALLKAGAQANVTDKSGMTPLLAAVSAQREDFSPIVPLLLKAGAQVNVADAKGRTPLMFVTATADVALLTQMISAGARLDAADKAGRTPLIYAVTTAKVDPVQLLLDKGAKANGRDKDGLTAYLWAVRTHGLTLDSGEPNPVLAPLVKAGADPNAKDSKNQGAREWDQQAHIYAAIWE